MHLGIDVGGTKTEICLLSSSAVASQVFRERMETKRDLTLSDFFIRLRALLKKSLDEKAISFNEIKTIGIGLPGSIDPLKQTMLQGSVSFFKNIDLKKVFSKEISTNGNPFSGTMKFDNDANCFALAEAYFGAGKKWADLNGVSPHHLCLVGITLGTGVGGGLIVNGNLIRGRRGGAGEIGHMTLVEAGRPCYCGKHGCSEQYLSGPAFEHFFQTHTETLKPLSGKEIFELAEQNNPFAISAIESYRDRLVEFLSNLSNLLDPHVIVLGGGMSTQRRIYEGMSERLSKACFLTKEPPAVIRNELGGSAGVIGAALLPEGVFKSDDT
jgi:fructokinase